MEVPDTLVTWCIDIECSGMFGNGDNAVRSRRCDGLDSCVSVDPFNMSRNVKIILTMMCLTMAVHIVLYYHDIGRYKLWPPANAESLLLPTNTSLNASLPTVPPTRQTPTGDGELFQLIESSKAPFVADFPKQLVILGYQRVGSSFLGQILDGNPSFFYVYEPLDTVYSEMYGTKGGLNVPSDITYLPNGNPRTIPEREKKAVRNMLMDILNCNVEKLPPGFILHKYWYMLTDKYMKSWLPYRSCLKHHQVLQARETCWDKHLQSVCSIRFGMDSKLHSYCHEKLRDSAPGEADPFTRYHLCLQTAYLAAKPCLNMFRAKCETARLWAVKTVRSTMDELDELMESNPNMRIIHLIRDPRAVVVSRSRDYSFRGIYSGDIQFHQGPAGNKIHEAHIYCGTVAKDILHRQQLESMHPGKIVQVIYEDFAQNPVKYAQAIYQFLDEDIPQTLEPWIQNNTQGETRKHNAKIIMNAWKSKVTYTEAEQIVHECEEFYKLLKYEWPFYET